MNDEELRQLIRAAIQKHASTSAQANSDELRRDAAFGGASEYAKSISFGQYRLERTDGDTSCIIEPAVQCNHCGFCKCHGH
ncbi:MAG TPA: hypothetical protein VM096_00530 [Vicinamibacterales bacterium]|nr:hypothetical protein [Vicinamibacterales bacterium]